MYVCPVCNGIIDYIKYCPHCGAKMEMYDRVENYYDGYSPYLSYEITDMNGKNENVVCHHLVICPECGKKEIIPVFNIQE